MKLLEILGFQTKKNRSVSGFMIRASNQEKQRVFTEVAERANEQQREMVRKAEAKV